MRPSPAVALRDVTFSHDRRPAVHHLTGVFEPGGLTAIVGANGAGKTTLLRGLARIHAIDEGSIDFGGLSRRQVALMPQAATLDRAFPVTCLEAVALAGVARAGLWRGLTRVDRASAEAALDAVGLTAMASRPIGEVSAGQFQRALFARVIMQDAPLILLDEPFAAVDEATEADLLGIVRRWHAEGRTIIAVLHDLDLVRRRFPHALLLAREPVAWGATEAVLTQDQLRRAGLRASLVTGLGAEPWTAEHRSAA